VQVRGEKRFLQGYTVGMSYTWSKNMEVTRFLNAGDPAVNRNISQYDRPHRLNIGAVYDCLSANAACSTKRWTC
jgi:hypothetical protein